MFEKLFDRHKKKHRALKDINVEELSLVNKPANRQPFLFFKSEADADEFGLNEVLLAAAEEMNKEEIEELRGTCAQLQKITEEQANAISVLVLGSGGDSPVVTVDKDDNITYNTDDEDEADILSTALEVLGNLDSVQLSATRVLLKMDGSFQVKWPSLVQANSESLEEVAEDDNEPVRKNTSGLKWPTLCAHVPEKVEVVQQKSGLRWPSISGRQVG